MPVLDGLAWLICHSKSQIAIEYCYRYKDCQPNGHVFWVHSSNRNRFAQAYKEIAKKLNLRGLDNPNTDPLLLVKEWLSGDDSGPWIMVIDNADDKEAIFGTNVQASLNSNTAFIGLCSFQHRGGLKFGMIRRSGIKKHCMRPLKAALSMDIMRPGLAGKCVSLMSRLYWDFP